MKATGIVRRIDDLGRVVVPAPCEQIQSKMNNNSYSMFRNIATIHTKSAYQIISHAIEKAEPNPRHCI